MTLSNDSLTSVRISQCLMWMRVEELEALVELDVEQEQLVVLQLEEVVEMQEWLMVVVSTHSVWIQVHFFIFIVI